MYTYEQRKKAIDTLIKNEMRILDTLEELGYPNRRTLFEWRREYERTGEIPKPPKRDLYTPVHKLEAVEYYLSHGRKLAPTLRALGFPANKEILKEWIDELAPGMRKVSKNNPSYAAFSDAAKARVLIDIDAGIHSNEAIARWHGISTSSLYKWKREARDNHGGPKEGGAPMSRHDDDLPDDLEELKAMISDAKAELRRVELEIDIRKATLEIIKKGQGTDPNRLTNAEKARMVDVLRDRYRLQEVLSAVGMAKSSYEYARRALRKKEERVSASKICKRNCDPSASVKTASPVSSSTSTERKRMLLTSSARTFEPSGRVRGWPLTVQKPSASIPTSGLSPPTLKRSVFDSSV